MSVAPAKTLAERACDALILAFAFVLPLSIAATEITLVLALACWLTTRPWRRPWPRGLVVLAWASLALLASWLLSSAFSASPRASFLEVRKLYSMAALFLVADRVRTGGVEVSTLALSALAAGALSAVLGVIGFALHRANDVVPGYRLESVFSNAMTSGNVFATLAVAGAGAALALRASSRRAATIALVASVLCAMSLVLTLTRSSWLAFGAGIAVLLGFTRARWLALAGVIVALALAFGPQELRDRARSVADPTYITNVGRISLWKSGWVAFLERPVFGHGLQDMLDLIARLRRPDATFVAGHHHNNWVQVAVSTGIVGLAAFAFWMFAAFALLAARLRGPGRPWAVLGLAVWTAFQVHGLFDWSFGDVEVVDQLYLWLGLALGAAFLGSVAGGEPGALQHASPRRGV